jgi:hypothetical protein
MMLACHEGEDTIPPNPVHNKFKACRRCGLVLQLYLPICHQSFLVYLVVEGLTSFHSRDLGLELQIVH